MRYSTDIYAARQANDLPLVIVAGDGLMKGDGSGSSGVDGLWLRWLFAAAAAAERKCVRYVQCKHGRLCGKR